MATFQKSQNYVISEDNCVLLAYAVHTCEVTHPNFDTEGYKAKAGCLCYDNSGNYAPGPWDNAAATCVATGATAHPTIYSLLAANNSAAVGLCTNYAASSAATASPTTSVTVTTISDISTLGTATNTSTPTASSAANSGARGNPVSLIYKHLFAMATNSYFVNR
jgi:hypothetical protein